MIEFRFTHESNLAVGQIVQECDCADARVTVAPLYDRDRGPILFSAGLEHIARRRKVETSAEDLTEWRSRKHEVGAYNLTVRPNPGTTHHDYRDIPFDENFQHDIPLLANRTTDVTVRVSRKASVIYDIPYEFGIEDDGTASSQAPFIESGLLAALLNDFPAWPQLISASAARFSVPQILILSIAVMETTHGWYDEPMEWVGMNKSIRPMNINIAYWSRLFSESDMYVPALNFDAGAFLLKRIFERLAPQDRSIRKIATLYNNINAASVTDYGARVEYFTKTLRPDWLPVPPR